MVATKGDHVYLVHSITGVMYDGEVIEVTDEYVKILEDCGIEFKAELRWWSVTITDQQ